MTVTKEYVVYEMTSIMGSDLKALEEVEFKGWKHNSFNTEDEAIQALIDDELNYGHYITLRQVSIDSYS